MAEQRTLTQSISEVVLVPSLLSAAGGFIDAFAWLAYAHVFTNAQTGNIILIGVSAANGDWLRIERNRSAVIARG